MFILEGILHNEVLTCVTQAERYGERVQILIVTPAPRGSRLGNRVTALRWAGHLRKLGHVVRVREQLDSRDCDLLVALHAQKSATAIAESKRTWPTRPVVLVLTGTDVYGELSGDAKAEQSLKLSDRIVVLQSGALAELPALARAKAEVVPQSARVREVQRTPDSTNFEVLVIAHLRPVKDPLLTARAARRLPSSSRLQVRLIGQSLDEALQLEVEREAKQNPRFEWLGPLRHAEVQERLGASQVLVVSSHNEGGPAVITEAIAWGVPVLSTRMPAALSLLGEGYPGLYPRGDEAALAALLRRCEEDATFLNTLREQVRSKRDEVRPEREREHLRALLASIVEHPSH